MFHGKVILAYGCFFFAFYLSLGLQNSLRKTENQVSQLDPKSTWLKALNVGIGRLVCLKAAQVKWKKMQ